MSRWMAGLLMLLALALSPGIALATAIGEPLDFDSEAQRQQYETLTREPTPSSPPICVAASTR